MTRDSSITVGRVVRVVFGTAFVTLLVVAFVVGGDPRLYGAAAACGTIWWVWDLLTAYVFEPLGDWITGTVIGGTLGGGDPASRLSLDDLVALLERHLDSPTSRQVDINAAIRLEEIYRTVKKDPAAARRVVDKVRQRYPDAPELARFSRGDGDEV